MPSIYEALLLEEGTENALVEKGLTFEVEQQLGDGVVRCIALGSSDGLRRGMKVKATGEPISVPVGKGTLGRIMDVLGRPIDEVGPMNEPPGNRLRVGLSGLTMAEHFRDEGRDLLFFVDNIYRFTLAGVEVSALLGRMPSAVGYQPTLAEEMGRLQERITSTKTG